VRAEELPRVTYEKGCQVGMQFQIEDRAATGSLLDGLLLKSLQINQYAILAAASIMT
jgi:hypothetical protein